MTGDFKALLDRDMAVFHNAAEMAHAVGIRYMGQQRTIPAVIDHTAAQGRRKQESDHAEGLHRADCLVYVALRDLGVVPKQGRSIEIEEAGAATEYVVAKADLEDGEVVLELELMEE